MGKSDGYESDDEHLDEVAEWLHVRSARIDADRQLRGAEAANRELDELYRGQPPEKLRCRLVLLREAEDQLHEDLGRRLDAHRMGPYPALGIDSICEESRLTEDERFVLVATAIASISTTVGDATFGPLYSSYSGMQISDIAQLLGAITPSEWLAYRRLFLPNSPLLKNGLVVVDHVPQGPEDLMGVSLSVGRETFALITGTEVEPEDYEPEGTE